MGNLNKVSVRALVGFLLTTPLVWQVQVVVAQDFRTTTFFLSESTLPTPSLGPIQQQLPTQIPPIPAPISALPLSGTPKLPVPAPLIPSLPPVLNIPPSSPSSPPSPATNQNDPNANPIANTLISAPTNTAFPFPFPLPEGIARTSSGRPIPCSPKNTKLNPTTHKLISECVETSFCGAPPGSPINATGLGVCFPRLCRRDVFPFGYGTYGGGEGRRKNATVIPIPPMCAKGTFCPDNGSGCRALVAISGRCELARDEQCAPPPPNPKINEKDNKSICLHSMCMPATQLLGEPCTIENTTYVSDLDKGAAGGGQFRSFVIKHDCLSPSLFCDPSPNMTTPAVNGISTSSGTCQKSKSLTEICRFDAECRSNNCGPTNTCIPSPESSFRIAPWQWFATILFILLLLGSIALILAFVHRRQRYRRYQELQAYYYEQMSLRRSILALHAAASAEKMNKSEDDSVVKAKERL